ncbi:hypothetical protein D3C75_962810 [compost metagenome]
MGKHLNKLQTDAQVVYHQLLLGGCAAGAENMGGAYRQEIQTALGGPLHGIPDVMKPFSRQDVVDFNKVMIMLPQNEALMIPVYKKGKILPEQL